MSVLLTDLHAPLLPGPDGAIRTFADAARRLERARLHGIWKAILTPRIDARDREPAELAREILRNRRTLEELRRWCRDLGGIPGLALGHEVLLGNVGDAERLGRVAGLGLGDTRWLLVDFGTGRNGRDRRPVEAIRALRRAGYQVLVSRPERHGRHGQPDPLLEIRRWHDAGAALLVGAEGLEGRDGVETGRLARELVDEELVHVVASGAASGKRRHPLRAAARSLAFRRSPDEAVRLVSDNPRRILRNLHRADLPVREAGPPPSSTVPEPAA